MERVENSQRMMSYYTIELFEQSRQASELLQGLFVYFDKALVQLDGCCAVDLVEKDRQGTG